MRNHWVVESSDVSTPDHWKRISSHKNEVLACKRLLREYREMKRVCGGDAWNANWRVRNTSTEFIYDSIGARFIGQTSY